MTARRLSVGPARARCSPRLRAEELEARDLPSFVTGTVFNDLDGNTVRAAGEPGLEGWTAFIDNNRNGVLDAGEASALTDASGNYGIDTTAVPPFVGTGGTHYDYVAFVLQTGTGGRWLNTTQEYRLVNRDTTPDGIGQDFGAWFHSDADAGIVGVGGDQLVNAVTSGQQGLAGTTVSTDASGRYVAGWRTINAGGNDVLSVRAFNADGTPLSPEVTVATPVSTFNDPVWVIGPPAVAMADTRDQFAVAWAATNPANGQFNAYVSIYSKEGVRLSGPTSVAASSSTIRNFVAGLASDAAGNFVVLYTQFTQNHSGYWAGPTVYAQRFTSGGAATGRAINVVSPNLFNGNRSVAMADNGNFVVVYDENTRTGSNVFAQRYSAAGQKVGSLITVASSSTTLDWLSRVTMNAAGRFVVMYYERGAGYKVRTYTADGVPVGAVGAVAPGAGELEGGIGAPSFDDADNITVSWTENRGGSAYQVGEVHIQRLPAGATAPLAETLANATTQGVQGGGYSGSPLAGAALAATGPGTFVAVWSGNGPGDDAGIFAQRFAPVSGGASAALTSVAAPSPVGAVDLTGLEWFGADGKKDRL